MSAVQTLFGDLRAAVRARILGTPGLPPVVSWEGIAFTPATGTPWLRERLAPIASQVLGLGVGGTIVHRVVANLTLFYPSGRGTVEIETAAGLLLAAFAPSTSLVHGTTAARVAQAERAPLQHEPSWVSCPVAITILAYTPS
ncbi:phage tail terminator-like protein [Rubellimicrobium sp. CFH 75288]|uniref:phage tail terminator-like protein n=1 Tax=Rubellimicrobium sp. CFH 75288 TaxID=2697034 RepID=UPI001412DE26|nr:phage tail terminator-like protein [Rubellimicrobium sp. CFH 75288]NAZ37149.1 hypothetical protein [Rubellimicrobium sp. CFH 75288]